MTGFSGLFDALSNFFTLAGKKNLRTLPVSADELKVEANFLRRDRLKTREALWGVELEGLPQEAGTARGD